MDWDPRAPRESSGLIQPIHLQTFRQVGERLHSKQVTASEIVAEAAMQQVGQLRGAGLQSLQKESRIRQLVFVRRFRKEFQSLLVSGCFLHRIEIEVQVGKDFQIRERDSVSRQGSDARWVL